jgi:hypothetical protein
MYNWKSRKIMKVLRKIADWCLNNWKFFVIIGVFFTISFWVVTNSLKIKELQMPIVDAIVKEQGKRIEILEKQLLILNKELRSRVVADSILYENGQKRIAELNKQIQNNKDENKKKHIANDNADFNESASILKSNIKKRGKKY